MTEEEKKLSVIDITRISAAQALRFLRSHAEFKDKSAEELTVLIDQSVEGGREEAEGYLNKETRAEIVGADEES